jgi:hypothetical protein
MIPRPRRALTLTDLVILLAMMVLLAPAVLRSSQRSREIANRVKCGSNLRMIGQAILLYANENKGNYPRTMYQIDAPPTQYTGVQAPNPFGSSGPSPNDVTAALFLLIRTQDIESERFVCPSTDRVAWDFGGPGKNAQQVSNFPGEQNLSYSYANPYPGRAAIDRGYKSNHTVGAEFGVAADMNPGKGGGFDATLPKSHSAPVAQMKQANSRNHGGDGQNVLYGDGHVDFVQNPFVGVYRDNIYTVSGGGNEPNVNPTSATIVGLPVWQGDSVLLPVATITPMAAGAAATKTINMVLIIAGVMFLVAVGVVLLVVFTRKPKTAPAMYGGPDAGPPPPVSRGGPPPLPPR